jgi:hypothetical protein
MKPSAEDWIILRLIFPRVGPEHFNIQCHADANKATSYLRKKLGAKTVNRMINQLIEETV